MSNCSDCSQSTGKKYAKYCDGCRWKHRGKKPTYMWTPEKDAVLRSRYDGRHVGVAEAIAKSFGWPKYVISRRASTLGLSVPRKSQRWTEQEQAFLEENAGVRHLNWMAKQLGRTVASVALRLKRQGISCRVTEGYRLRDLCDCFGVDHHAVQRWIRLGWLSGKRRSGSREATYPLDPWQFTDGDILRFVRCHPTAFDLRRVEQTWFLSLIFGDKFGRREQAS